MGFMPYQLVRRVGYTEAKLDIVEEVLLEKDSSSLDQAGARFGAGVSSISKRKESLEYCTGQYPRAALVVEVDAISLSVGPECRC